MERKKLIELLDGYYPDPAFLADKILGLFDVSGTFTAEDMKNFAAKIWLTRNKDNIKPLDEELEIFCRIDR